MTTLYRAHKPTASHVAGTCWTARRDHAEAYRSNAGFGGDTMYAVETDARHVLDLTGPRLIAELADALDDCADLVATAERWCRGSEDTDGLTGARALAAWMADVVAGSDKGRAYAVWEERPEIRAALAEGWDWVTYDDDYPAGCVTWLYLGADPLPASVVE